VSTDPRVYIASKALAEAMGVPDERNQYIPEARAVLRAPDGQSREEAA
jgi:hypothetical protein